MHVGQKDMHAFISTCDLISVSISAAMPLSTLSVGVGVGVARSHSIPRDPSPVCMEYRVLSICVLNVELWGLGTGQKRCGRWELVGGDGGWRGRHRPTRKQEKAELERVGTVGGRKWGGGRSGELERQFSTSMRGYVRMDSGWDGRG